MTLLTLLLYFTTTPVVAAEPTTTTLVASHPNFSDWDLFATVTTSSGPVGSGIVTFYDGSTVVGSKFVGGDGIASIRPPQLSTGPHSITATYDGTAEFSASTSTLTITVGPGSSGRQRARAERYKYIRATYSNCRNCWLLHKRSVTHWNYHVQRRYHYAWHHSTGSRTVC